MSGIAEKNASRDAGFFNYPTRDTREYHIRGSAVLNRSDRRRFYPRALLDWRVRRLIVNADDFGYTAGVNRAIVEAHTRGIVTSATLMANGLAFSEAARIASEMPRLSVGCHVVLIEGAPLLSPNQIPSLSSATGKP